MKKVVLIAAIAVVTLSADPLMTYVGTKAKGMGGAFTAIANNNSAMYFNPAGLSNFEGMKNASLTIEGGIGAKIDESSSKFEDYFTSGTSYFFGVSIIGKDGGFGFAMYSLYDLRLEDGTNNGSYLQEEITIMSISAALMLIDQIYSYGGGLSMGVTAAYASSFSEDDSDVLDVNGYFYSVGAKMRILNHRAFKIDLGINYRSSAELASDDDSYSHYKGVGVPEEIAFGVAISYGTEFGLFTLAGDYKFTGYADATANTDFNIRIDDVKTKTVGLDFSNPTYQIRGGIYNTEYDVVTTNEISGYSVGLGFVFSEGFSIEGSYDRRTYSYGTKETTTPYLSAAFNIAF